MASYTDKSGKTKYMFSFGPWNIHPGADPFGPAVRPSMELAKKIKVYKNLGFDGIQLHDDDVVPDINDQQRISFLTISGNVREMLEDEGLTPEFVAPRLWEDELTIDGAFTSNNRKCRQYALERSKRAIDIANELGTDLIVLWLAREGTYIRESKDPVRAVGYLTEAIDTMLEYGKEIRIAIEAKPNEPMDQAYIPTTGHAVALGFRTMDSARVGIVVESAHAILAGLDPSDEMGFALAYDKLWTVHLNDQNGLKFDEDRAFGSVNLRRAFNQVYVLEKNGYGRDGRMVGLDVKALRTQPSNLATKHLRHSRETFLALLEKVRTFDEEKAKRLRAAGDYEALDSLVLSHLLGK